LNDKIKNYERFDKKSQEKKIRMKSQETNKIYKPFKKKSKEWGAISRDEKLEDKIEKTFLI